jgi:hypothetical protein
VLTRRVISWGWVVVATADVLGVVTVAATWTSVLPGWPYFLTSAAALVIAPYAAGALGDSAHRGRRGSWRSKRYGHLLRPRDGYAEEDYSHYKNPVFEAVRTGKIPLGKLPKVLRDPIRRSLEKYPSDR